MILGQRTDVGLKRQHNEDSLASARIGVRIEDRGVDFALGVVCDGMGGAAAGEVASALAVSTIVQGMHQRLFDLVADPEAEFVEVRALLRACIEEANRVVHGQAKDRPGQSGMGCTATAMCAGHGRLFFGQVGDSRGYRLRGGQLSQITFDHSFVGELLRDGRITPEEAEAHPRKSVITRAIGSRPEVEVDVFEHRLQPGDLYFVCSDGLTGMVPDEDLKAMLEALPEGPTSADLDACCDRMIAAANEAGGVDNISVVLAAVEEADCLEVLEDPILLGRLASERVLTWTEAAERGIGDVSFVEVDNRRGAVIG